MYDKTLLFPTGTLLLLGLVRLPSYFLESSNNDLLQDLHRRRSEFQESLGPKWFSNYVISKHVPALENLDDVTEEKIPFLSLKWNQIDSIKKNYELKSLREEAHEQVRIFQQSIIGNLYSCYQSIKGNLYSCYPYIFMLGCMVFVSLVSIVIKSVTRKSMPVPSTVGNSVVPIQNEKQTVKDIHNQTDATITSLPPLYPKSSFQTGNTKHESENYRITFPHSQADLFYQHLGMIREPRLELSRKSGSMKAERKRLNGNKVIFNSLKDPVAESVFVKRKHDRMTYLQFLAMFREVNEDFNRYYNDDDYYYDILNISEDSNEEEEEEEEEVRAANKEQVRISFIELIASFYGTPVPTETTVAKPKHETGTFVRPNLHLKEKVSRKEDSFNVQQENIIKVLKSAFLEAPNVAFKASTDAEALILKIPAQNSKSKIPIGNCIEFKRFKINQYLNHDEGFKHAVPETLEIQTSKGEDQRKNYIKFFKSKVYFYSDYENTRNIQVKIYLSKVTHKYLYSQSNTALRNIEDESGAKITQVVRKRHFLNKDDHHSVILQGDVEQVQDAAHEIEGLERKNCASAKDRYHRDQTYIMCGTELLEFKPITTSSGKVTLKKKKGINKKEIKRKFDVKISSSRIIPSKTLSLEGEPENLVTALQAIRYPEAEIVEKTIDVYEENITQDSKAEYSDDFNITSDSFGEGFKHAVPETVKIQTSKGEDQRKNYIKFFKSKILESKIVYKIKKKKTWYSLSRLVIKITIKLILYCGKGIRAILGFLSKWIEIILFNGKFANIIENIFLLSIICCLLYFLIF